LPTPSGSGLTLGLYPSTANRSNGTFSLPLRVVRKQQDNVNRGAESLIRIVAPVCSEGLFSRLFPLSLTPFGGCSDDLFFFRRYDAVKVGNWVFSTYFYFRPVVYAWKNHKNQIGTEVAVPKEASLEYCQEFQTTTRIKFSHGDSFHGHVYPARGEYLPLN